MKLLTPGIYDNLSSQEYHNLPYASNSKLSELKRSPKHLKHLLDYGSESSSSFLIGSAVHTAVLEPEKFSETYGILPEGHGNSKAVKEARIELADKFGDNLLTHSQVKQCDRIREAVYEHKKAKKLIDLKKNVELSLIWDDPETDVRCKARIDLVCKNGIVADLKTTTDASQKKFTSSILQYGYYRQAGMYLKACQVLGIEAHSFVIIACEKTSPYACAVYSLDPALFNIGWDEIRQQLKVWKKCQETGKWPSYNNEDVVNITAPDWMVPN